MASKLRVADYGSRIWVVALFSATACAYAVEPKPDDPFDGAAGLGGVGGTGGNMMPIPSATSTSPALPSGGTPGAGGASSMGGAAMLPMGGSMEPVNTGGSVSGGTGGQGMGGAPTSVGGAPTGGAPPVVGEAFSCEASTPPVQSFKVQAKTTSGLEPANQIQVNLNLLHTGASSESVDLSRLTVRYWFTADGVSGLSADCDYARMGCQNVRWRFGQATGVEADSYLEVGFIGAAGKLAPNFDSGEIQLRFHNSSYQGSMTRGNDHSGKALGAEYAEQSNITVHDHCELVWGSLPQAN